MILYFSSYLPLLGEPIEKIFRGKLVGVTLTAASTILFAELFWTPAILIQAEDR